MPVKTPGTEAVWSIGICAGDLSLGFSELDNPVLTRDASDAPAAFVADLILRPKRTVHVLRGGESPHKKGEIAVAVSKD
jgi:hypothetical protein